MENLAQAAAVCFNNGFNCAQAVFSACAARLGLTEETALKISCGFGSGMGGLQETCGAVTGAFMVIGLKYGKSLQNEDEKKLQTYKLIRQLAEAFKRKNGSFNCRQLIGCDLLTPEGMAFAKENNLFQTKCLNYVKDAAGMVEKMLETP